MKTLVVMSGGLDSTVLAHQLKSRGRELFGITFDYGQRHSRELLFAGRQAEELGIQLTRVDIQGVGTVLAGKSALLRGGADVPHGHYTSEQMKQTVVPNRNMIMLSIAAGHAITLGCEAVAYAAHLGDHAIYPDCRGSFIEAVAEAIRLCDWSDIILEAPFVDDDLDKSDIVKLGEKLGVQMGLTWSCYNGRAQHCGNCGTCVERREAFEVAGVQDTTAYEGTAKPLETLLGERNEIQKNNSAAEQPTE